MAEALEKDMIPCENCSEQVNLDDWSIHVVCRYRFFVKKFDIFMIFFHSIVETLLSW